MAMGVLSSAFMRRSGSRGSLTDIGEHGPSRPRGRPTDLSDPQLWSRRDQLVQIFEATWGDIGWDLPRCKKADDLIRIFTPVAAPGSWFQDAMMLFCHPSSEAASALRKVEAELKTLSKPMHIAQERMNRAREQLRQVVSALTQAHGRSRRIVKGARKKRRKEFWKAARLHRDLFNRFGSLEARLRDSRASFARQELLRFLKSKRYMLTPRSIACAAAGLPYTGWRQSMRRSVKAPWVIAEGPSYQIFKAIRYLTANATKSTEHGLVISFEDSIPSLPSRYRLAKIELAGKWFYLERALRKAYRRNPHPKKFPFEITRLYFNQLKSQSPVETVLAEQAQLKLSEAGNAHRQT